MSPELGGGWSPKNAEGIRGQSWENSEIASEWKRAHPLTDPLYSYSMGIAVQFPQLFEVMRGPIQNFTGI